MDEIIASPMESRTASPRLQPASSRSSPSSSPLSSVSLPSSPLSMLSRSPSPPCSPTIFALDGSDRYPSPSSSSQARSDTNGDASDKHQHFDGPPPAKRRRTQASQQRRPRMTRYLDLNEQISPESEEELGYLLQAFRKKKRIIVIAGAGISVSAGIPDFRSSTGLFTTLRGQHGLKGSGKHLFDASVYKHDSSTSSFHSMVRELAHMTQNAKPTAFHQMLASIAHEGRLMRLYSQNVDCIDTNMEPLATKVPLNAKGPWPPTIQLHGGLSKMVCSKCGDLREFDGSLFDGPEAPLCPNCAEMDMVRTTVANKRSHGIGRLRPRIVLYNEYNPDEEAIGNVSQADLRRGADAVIVVGTSLKIPGVRRLVKELCQVTRSRRDGFTAWINVDPEPQGAEFRDCWDLVVRGNSDDVARMTELPSWNAPRNGSSSVWTIGSDDKKLSSIAKLEVVLGDGAPQKPIVTPSKNNKSTIKAEDDKNTTPSKVRKPSLSLRGFTTPKASRKIVASPVTSMPTPIASPKPSRKRLPDVLAGGSSRQTKLLFQHVENNAGTVANSTATVEEAKGTAAEAAPKTGILGKKPIAKKGRTQAPKPKRQTKVRGKKAEQALSKNVELSFRATKHIAMATSQGKKRVPSPTVERPQILSPTGKYGYQNNASVRSSNHSDLSSASDGIKQELDAGSVKLPSLRYGNSGFKAHIQSKDSRLVPSPLSLEHKVHQVASDHDCEGPCTPSGTQSRRASDAANTISPHSVPRGMGTLID